MHFLSYFFLALAEVLNIVLGVFMWIIIAKVVLSWINPDPYNPIIKFIHATTNPVINKLKSKVPTSYAGIDFSPIIIFLGIIFLKIFLVNSLTQMARIII